MQAMFSWQAAMPLGSLLVTGSLPRFPMRVMVLARPLDHSTVLIRLAGACVAAPASNSPAPPQPRGQGAAFVASRNSKR